MRTLLRLRDVKVCFGGIKALDGVSVTLTQGLTYGLVGPNGSGKTTLVNAICGQYRLTSGAIELRECEISGEAPDAIYRSGLARTFQGLRLVPELSVRDNVFTGVDHVRGRQWGKSRESARAVDRAIERLGLEAEAFTPAGDLPYGTQRRVEIARAISADPAMLVLDEPVAGMNFTERKEISNILRELHTDGLTMLLIEHDMKFVLSLSDELIVMNFGRVLAQGEPYATAVLPSVKDAYLGRRRDLGGNRVSS